MTTHCTVNLKTKHLSIFKHTEWDARANTLHYIGLSRMMPYRNVHRITTAKECLKLMQFLSQIGKIVVHPLCMDVHVCLRWAHVWCIGLVHLKQIVDFPGWNP